MKDWKGLEGIFHRGDLSVEDLLELTEPHFTFRGIPVEETFFMPIPRNQFEADIARCMFGPESMAALREGYPGKVHWIT